MNPAAFRRLAPWSISAALVALLGGCVSTETGVVRGDTRNQVIISIRDQKLTVVQPDHHRVTFPISTSKFGFGDRRGSYTTPLGELEVAQKIGGGAPAGSVFRSRIRTGEIVGIDAPGRDAIVTRILALRGLESKNRDAYARGIYIHGTPEERNIGRPSSYGCIRMRSRDVIALYDMIGVGAKVQIIDTTVNQAIAANIVTPTARATPPAVAAPPPAPPMLMASNEASKKVSGNMIVAGDYKPAVPVVKEWAGSPSKMLAKEAKVDEKAKNAKPIGAARASSSATSEASDNSSAHDLNRAVLDSL